MQINKWEPLKDIDHFFDNRFLQPLTKITNFGFDLAVDVYEEGKNVIAKMVLPDVDTKELDISIERDMLTIKGKREEEKEVEKKDYYSKEIRRGSFIRSIELPKVVDGDKTEAVYDHGVLVVTMPAVPNMENKSIKVKIKS